MRMVLKIAGLIVVLLLALVGLQMVASESGEVVVVTTTVAEGESTTTRLWIVDMDGVSYLRAGSPMAGWYQRMQADPQINVVRGGEQFSARVEPQPQLRDAINALMRTKYGWADQVIEALYGRDDAIPLRLHPL